MSKAIISTLGTGVTSVRTAEGIFTSAKIKEVFLDDGRAKNALATAITGGHSKDYGKEII